MNLLELKISITWFFVAFLVLPFVGFIFRSAQLQKKKMRIKELEEEMINNHAEILSLQGQLVVSQNKESKVAATRENALVVDNVSKAKLKVSAM